MSDTIPSDTPAPAVAEPVSASPVDPVAPASTPAIESAEQGAIPEPVAAEPVAEPAAEVVAEPAEPAAETPDQKLHTDEPTLFEQVGDDAAPTEPAAPVAYDFKLPEGVDVAPEQMQVYTGLLQETGISPEIGQKLLDLHTAQVERYAAETLARQHEAFADVRREWRDQIKGDPQLGGAGFETVSKAVARARDLLVPEADRGAFNDMLRATGVGDHPAFWRMMLHASRFMDEPPPPSPNARPSPTANPTPKRGLDALFDHPNSQRR